MKRMQLESRWVLVTGASSGLGREIATQLARDHRANLILVARRQSRLEELQQELESEYGVQVRVQPADLSDLDQVERLFEVCTRECNIYAVVLDAGVTFFGRQQNLAWDEFQRMLATNVNSVVRLVNRFVPYLLSRNDGGGLLIVSSLAGIIPLPYQAAYSGTKAFLTNFGLALAYELRHENLSITVFAPGGIATEMLDKSGLREKFADSPFTQSVTVCARSAIRAMQRRRRLAVPGVLNKIAATAARCVPRIALTALVGRAYQRALEAKPRSVVPSPNSSSFGPSS